VDDLVLSARIAIDTPKIDIAESMAFEASLIMSDLFALILGYVPAQNGDEEGVPEFGDFPTTENASTTPASTSSPTTVSEIAQ